MEQPYSIAADWLSKFHTWPEFIQALWLVAVPVTVLGVTWLVMRGLRDIAAVLRGRGEATLYGVPSDWRAPALMDRGGRLLVADGETPVPPLPAPAAPSPSFRGTPPVIPGRSEGRAQNP
ncbi:hypothetical protein [Microvirga subterranea]|uniref:Uncharacterized protein n=1 Tax=Microvirga subterranea TaxID=186651 RepID=A0A370H7A2_9HYPH|nr:hypothetical protein [Microvirga subterranea]RDI52411.1 hypothetical protein DES45_11536 [Microvirga subterranea]